MIGKLRTKIHEGGLIGLVVILLNRLPGVAYFLVWSVYRLPLDAEFSSSEGEDLQVSFHGGPEGIDSFLAVRDKRERFQTRLEHGTIGALAKFRGTPVGYVWLQLTSDPVEERHGFTIKVESTDVYDFDSYVRSDYRGRGVLRVLHREIARRYTQAPDKTHLAAIIEAPNRRSIRAYEYMGFRKGTTHCAFKAFGSERVLRLG